MSEEQFGTIALKVGDSSAVGSPLIESPPLQPAEDATIIEWSQPSNVPAPSNVGDATVVDQPPRPSAPAGVPQPALTYPPAPEVSVPPPAVRPDDTGDVATFDRPGLHLESGPSRRRSLRREEVDAVVDRPAAAPASAKAEVSPVQGNVAAEPRNRNDVKARAPEAARPIDPPPAEFSPVRFHFTAGIGPGDTAQVCDDSAKVLMTYRGFASALGTISIFVAGLVLLGGLAGALLLLIQGKAVLAFLAFILGIFFALAMIMLIPVTNVVLMSGTNTLLKIVQTSRSSFPVTRWKITTPDGQVVGILRKSVFTRLWRNRWTIANGSGKRIGYAREESLSRALFRAFAGKFNRRYEANVEIVVDAQEVAMIYRRPDERGAVDVLQIFSPTIDRRIAVALATLILGSEP